jgi:hypothetical protein
MSASRKQLEDQLEEYEEKLGGFNSYIRELKARVEEHGTDRALYETDLFEAEHNVAFYEGEIARLKGALGRAGGGPPFRGVIGGALPQTVNQGVGTLLLSTLCFAAGVLVGSRLLSNRGDD